MVSGETGMIGNCNYTNQKLTYETLIMYSILNGGTSFSLLPHS